MVDPYSALELHATPPSPSALTARFMGVSTIALSDGDTTILTDGFLSRPSLLRLLTSRIGPTRPQIMSALAKAEIQELCAVFVAHSRHDHALRQGCDCHGCAIGWLRVGSEHRQRQSISRRSNSGDQSSRNLAVWAILGLRPFGRRTRRMGYSAARSSTHSIPQH